MERLGQRLAVGTTDGVVLIYDLRTATKWRILQGHERAVAALAFSAAGDQVASFSVVDGTLRWWQAGAAGLFSFLGLKGSCIAVTRVEHTLPEDALVQLEWTGTGQQVALTANKATLGQFSPQR